MTMNETGSKYPMWIFWLRVVLVILLLLGFVAVTWQAAVFSHETNGEFFQQTLMLVIPAYVFIALGLAAAIAAGH